MPAYQAMTVLTICGAIEFGVVLALLGSIKLSLARQFDLGGKRVSGLLALFNFILIPLMLLSGYFVDAAGRTPLLLLFGSVLTAASIFAMSRAPSYRGALGAVLALGCGAAAVSVAVIKMMPLAFFDQKKPAQALCLGHVFIALGALLTPALSDVLTVRFGFRRAVALIAFLCLVPAVLCALPVFSRGLAERLGPTTPHPLAVLFAEEKPKALLMAGLVFFFYAPLEATLSVWVTTYLTDIGDGERRATWVLTGFWGALLGSRLLTALIPFTEAWYPWLIAVPAALAVVTLGNLASSGERTAPRRGLLLVGFLLGPIFPVLLAVLWNAFPHDMGMAYGCVFALGSLGSLMLAPLVSARTRAGEAKSPFGVPLALGLMLTFAALMFGLVVGRGR